jgi:glutamate racemase
MASQSAPIGVFDSGIGGLTVLKALAQQLPQESFVYLGDTARVPYGTKSKDVVTRYALTNAAALLQHEVKMIVVACNTATALALPAMHEALTVPVIGVIDPGAQAAVQASKGGVLAVIGTPGTIASGAYQTALQREHAGLRIRSRACPLFVPLAEEGWITGQVPTLVAEKYLGDEFLDGVDTLVLGCTHYPLLTQIISSIAGAGVHLVDSAQATASAVKAWLDAHHMRTCGTETGRKTFLVTDTPERFLEVGTRFLGEPIASAQQIDLSMI